MVHAPPLRVEAFYARGWRNLASTDLRPGPRFNVIAGDNGQGKSNLLEAIYYLGGLRSHRGAPSLELVQHGQDHATLAAKVQGPPAARRLEARVFAKGKARQLTLDGKRPRSSAVWTNAVPMVLFHPGELALGQGSPEGRRTMLDRALELLDPTYASTRSAYDKALRSRNRLLKDEADTRSVVAYDPILASAGAIMGRARAALVLDLAVIAEKSFASIIGEEVPVRVAYAPRVEPTEEALRAALQRSLDKDRARMFTAEGPHADDVTLEVHGHAAKHHASQGQHRALVLALKVAELEVLARRSGRTPVLLLDDVSSELDRVRSARLFSLLAARGGQVFVTTTMPELIVLDAERADFTVRAGEVRLLDGPGGRT